MRRKSYKLLAPLWITLLTLPTGWLSAVAGTPGAQAQRAVLVTGASTGIGRKITERLAADNYFVYAGARKDADLHALNAIKNVQAIRLDVTRTADIAAAVQTVSKAGRGLYGLVNNAGIVTLAPLVGTSQDEFDRVMAVNVGGPFRVTKAFAPLIIASRGRIVNIGSIAGILAIEGMGAYCMSKHALEAFTDTLALEMGPRGVHVSIIEPGGYQTEIFRSAAKRTGRTYTPLVDSAPRDPIQVAIVAERALFESEPKRRYLIVATEPEARGTIATQIKQLVELNEGQRYTYDRDALVRMLDDALVDSRPRVQ